MECVFCKIVSGEFNSFKIYEDDLFLAFLDIDPTSTGEVLVVTKSHFESMFDMPDDLLGNVYGVIKKLSVDISEKLNASSIQLIQNDYNSNCLEY